MLYRAVKYKFLTFILLMLFNVACQDYKESFEIIRNPYIKITTGSESFVITEFGVAYLGRVVNFNHEDSVYSRYERFVIYGLDSKNTFKKIEITYDLQDISDQVENYSFTYDEMGGISEALWTTSDSDLQDSKLYFSCRDGHDLSFFSITKHSNSEKIISGLFHVVLCDVDNTESTITIDGEFKDINYEEIE